MKIGFVDSLKIVGGMRYQVQNFREDRMKNGVFDKGEYLLVASSDRARNLNQEVYRARNAFSMK